MKKIYDFLPINVKSQRVFATDNNIHKIVEDEIGRLGNDADLNHIITKQVTNMNKLFEGLDFCGDISMWNTSKVTSMEAMFKNCKDFNCDLSKWDISHVKSMDDIFNGCEKFNMPLYSWEPFSLRFATKMFYKCKSFDQDMSKFIAKNLTDMSYMFYGCENFRGIGLDVWDVQNVEDFRRMFVGCKKLVCDLSKWEFSDKAKKFPYYNGSFYDCNLPKSKMPKCFDKETLNKMLDDI